MVNTGRWAGSMSGLVIDVYDHLLLQNVLVHHRYFKEFKFRVGSITTSHPTPGPVCVHVCLSSPVIVVNYFFVKLNLSEASFAFKELAFSDVIVSQKLDV